MYAVITDGSRQIKVQEGEIIDVDYRDIGAGETVTFDSVLAVSGDGGLKLGSPTLSGAKVTAEVVGPSQGPKLVVQAFRRRKNSRRKNGHRQLLTRVKISKISG